MTSQELANSIRTNLESINTQLPILKQELIELLTGKIDRTTFDYMEINDFMSMIELCTKAGHIYSKKNIPASFPPVPNLRTNDSILQKTLESHNKIQYCNNLLRYALRRYDINFHNSNKLHELIRYLEDVEEAPLEYRLKLEFKSGNGEYWLEASYFLEVHPVANALVQISDVDTNEVLLITYTNEQGKIIFKDTKQNLLNRAFQAMSYNNKYEITAVSNILSLKDTEVITNIEVNNGILDITTISLLDINNSNVVTDINIDNAGVIDVTLNTFVDADAYLSDYNNLINTYSDILLSKGFLLGKTVLDVWEE